MSEAEIIEITEEAKKPGIFSIVNVLKERAYPTTDVTVYLDEQVAYLASQLDEKIKELDKTLDAGEENLELEETLKGLKEQRADLVNKLSDSAYVFTIIGISEGAREDLIKIAEDKFPVVFTEEKNTFSGEAIRKEIPNDDRIDLIMNLIWEKHISKIVSPTGDVQDKFSSNDIIEIRRSLPIASSSYINGAIEKIRTSTALFMFSVDEDFLAKS